MTPTQIELSKLDLGTAITVMRNSGKLVQGDFIKVTEKALMIKVDGKKYPPIQLAHLEAFSVDDVVKKTGNVKEIADDIKAKGVSPPARKSARSKLAGAAVHKTDKKPTGKKDGILGSFAAYKIDPRTVLVREGWNPRVDMGDIKELAASIKAQGVREPLLLRRTKDGLEVVEGHRRMEAVLMLIKQGVDVPWVPATLEERGAEEATLLIHSLVNNSGKALLPLEECEAFRRLIAEGYDPARISAETGKSKAYIRSRLVLHDAGPALQKAIRDGLNVKTASQIAKQEKDPDKQRELVKDVVADRAEAKVKRQKLSQENRDTKKEEKQKEKEERARSSGKFDFNASKVLLGDLATAYMKWTRAEQDSEEEEQLYTEFHEVVLQVRQLKRNGDLKVKSRR